MSEPVTHISARVAWHDDGWNGRVCRDPKRNTFCVGQSSYPGDVIGEQRDLAWEASDSVAGRLCREVDGVPPCIYSINAFSEEAATAVSDPPDFFGGGKRREWELPAATTCVWPYEEMYSDEVGDGKGYYDGAARRAAAKRYFDALSPGRSLIFYYANYSNPFSEDDARRYAIVGVSRLKEVGDELFYDAVPDQARERHGGFVWARNVSSNYPQEGFRLPYHRFRDDEEALRRFLTVPVNSRNFKYGSRHISDDDALTIVEQLLQAAHELNELDDEERWAERIAWLSAVVAELWSGRGLYPGLLRVLVLDLLDEVRHRRARRHAPRGRVHRRARQLASAAHQLELRRGLHPPQPVHERRALDERNARQRVPQLQHRPRPGPRADGDPAGCAEAARGLGEEHTAVRVFVDDDGSGWRLPVQMEVDDHPRQHEERLAAGSEEGAGDPAVRIGEVTEARQVALEPGQVLEIGGGRQEERLEAALLEQGVQALAPLCVLFALNRHQTQFQRPRASPVTCARRLGGSHAWSSSTPATGSRTSTARSRSTTPSASRSESARRSARRRSTSSWGCPAMATGSS